MQARPSETVTKEDQMKNQNAAKVSEGVLKPSLQLSAKG